MALNTNFPSTRDGQAVKSGRFEKALSWKYMGLDRTILFAFWKKKKKKKIIIIISPNPGNKNVFIFLLSITLFFLFHLSKPSFFQLGHYLGQKVLKSDVQDLQNYCCKNILFCWVRFSAVQVFAKIFFFSCHF